jgi:hypothetical protein
MDNNLRQDMNLKLQVHFHTHMNLKQENEVGRTCGMHGRGEEIVFLVGKPKGKIPLGRPKCR